MIEFLPTDAPVIAMIVADRMTRSEIETYIDRLETSLLAHEKTHLYIEVRNLTEVDMDGMADHAMRAMKILGKLKRFGRIGVVADQSWVRWVTKLESALIPFVSYEAFTSDQREAALAWVEGKGDLPKSR